MIKQIEAVSIQKDHGDGGGSTCFYPTLEALYKAEFEEGYYDSDIEREEAYQGALNGDSMYDFGEIDQNVIIEVEEDKNGNLRLAASFSVSWGQ